MPGPGDIKSYWVVYNIPATVTKLAKNDPSNGVVGLNDKNRREYDPMKSKGPGIKKYHITVYALSKEIELPAEKATRAKLLTAIKDITLAEGTLDFQYDEADRGKRKIACPLLALWTTRNGIDQWYDVLAIWRDWADDVRGRAIESGTSSPRRPRSCLR